MFSLSLSLQRMSRTCTLTKLRAEEKARKQARRSRSRSRSRDRSDGGGGQPPAGTTVMMKNEEEIWSFTSTRGVGRNKVRSDPCYFRTEEQAQHWACKKLIEELEASGNDATLWYFVDGAWVTLTDYARLWEVVKTCKCFENSRGIPTYVHCIQPVKLTDADDEWEQETWDRLVAKFQTSTKKTKRN